MCPTSSISSGMSAGVSAGVVLAATCAACHPVASSSVPGVVPTSTSVGSAGAGRTASTSVGPAGAGPVASSAMGPAGAGRTASSVAGSAGPSTTAPSSVPPGTLVSASVRAAYIAGVYDGFVPVATLRALGDFGLGAADKNDGELVALDGQFYRALGDGSVVRLGDDELVPSASITAFRPERRLRLTGPLPRAELEARLDAWLDDGRPSGNRMFALRMHGRFVRVVAGASVAQTPPYRPFADIYREYRLIARDGVVGSLVGFRMPWLLRDVSKQGYHFHLLSDDLAAGGHVDDEIVDDVEVEAAELHGVHLILPDTCAFHAADLEAAARRR